MNRSSLLTLTAGFLAVATLAAQPMPANASPPQQDEPVRRTISVVGIGRANALPDVARVTLGVDVVNPRLGAALTEVNRKTAAVMAALEKAGVQKKDIQTVEFNVLPQQAYGPSGPGPITGYRVINAMRVTVRDLNNAGAVLDAAIGAGANNVQGLVFTVEDVRPVEASARRQAMADARAKANVLASEAGAKVGRVLTISEFIAGGPTPVFYAAPQTTEGMGGSVSIAPGTHDITVQVQVTYEIE